MDLLTLFIRAVQPKRISSFETVGKCRDTSTQSPTVLSQGVSSTGTGCCPQDIPTGFNRVDSRGNAPKASVLLLQGGRQLLNLVVDVALLTHELPDLAQGVHDRRMVTTTKLFPDLGE